MNRLIQDDHDANNAEALSNYKDYLAIVETILLERRTNILPKQATIVTTNYDLFVEKASLSYSTLKLNDGFSRVPSLDGRMEYSTRTFFNTTYNTGNLYNYKVEIPCINLLKLHGSLSWKKAKDEILFSVAKKRVIAGRQNPAQIPALHREVLP